LLRPELRDHWDLVVWIEIDLATALTRALERDIAWVKSADVVRERYESRNFPAHDLSVDRSGGSAVADIVIDNTDPHRPVLLRSPTASSTTEATRG
jgi:uridine kinase